MFLPFKDKLGNFTSKHWKIGHFPVSALFFNLSLSLKSCPPTPMKVLSPEKPAWGYHLTKLGVSKLTIVVSRSINFWLHFFHNWQKAPGNSLVVNNDDRTKPPGQNSPGHKPPDINAQDKNPPSQKAPGQKPPRTNLVNDKTFLPWISLLLLSSLIKTKFQRIVFIEKAFQHYSWHSILY